VWCFTSRSKTGETFEGDGKGETFDGDSKESETFAFTSSSDQ
jgi:hypothetical protein